MQRRETCAAPGRLFAGRLRRGPSLFNLRPTVSRLPLTLRAATVALATAGLAACAAPRPAARVSLDAAETRAGALTAAETEKLGRGETVVREETLEQGDKRYVGGFTYTLVDAPASELWTLFEDVDAYRRVLPKTQKARLVGHDGDDQLIELVQGNAFVQAEYTIRVRKDPEKRTVRFWLDPSRPHGIDDAWGFFRMQPFVTESGQPRLLLTYGILVDVGPGLVRELFEERVRAAMLSVPQNVRRYVVEARRAAYEPR